MSYYFNQISKIPMMSAQKEKEVALLASKGDKEAQNKLVQANLRFVVKIAGKFANRGVDFDDLVNEGNIGLMHAATKFNPSMNTRFITYAVWWIRHYMNKAVYETGYDVRVCVGKKQCLNNPLLRMASLDSPVGDGNDGCVFGDLQSDERNLNPEDQLLKDSVKNDLKNAMKCLSSTEKLVIAKRFGLFDIEPQSLQEIGDSLGYSKEGIRQVEKKALSKLVPAVERLGYAA